MGSREKEARETGVSPRRRWWAHAADTLGEKQSKIPRAAGSPDEKMRTVRACPAKSRGAAAKPARARQRQAEVATIQFAGAQNPVKLPAPSGYRRPRTEHRAVALNHQNPSAEGEQATPPCVSHDPMKAWRTPRQSEDFPSSRP
jgi:hypothetical protein